MILFFWQFVGVCQTNNQQAFLDDAIGLLFLFLSFDVIVLKQT